MKCHSGIYNRSCVQCQLFRFDENTGKMEMRGNKPVKRIPQAPAPCRTRKGCKKGTPENPKTLSLKNELTYNLYLETKAAGSLPEHLKDDPIIRRNFRMIGEIEETINNAKTENRHADLYQMLSLK